MLALANRSIAVVDGDGGDEAEEDAWQQQQQESQQEAERTNNRDPDNADANAARASKASFATSIYQAKSRERQKKVRSMSKTVQPKARSCDMTCHMYMDQNQHCLYGGNGATCQNHILLHPMLPIMFAIQTTDLSMNAQQPFLATASLQHYYGWVCVHDWHQPGSEEVLCASCMAVLPVPAKIHPDASAPQLSADTSRHAISCSQ